MYQLEEQENACLLRPQQPATHAIIWLHGLGADGYDFVELMPQFKLPTECQVLSIFPHAPVQSVTINGGRPMRAWYDIRTTDLLGDVDEAGIRVASQKIHHWIEYCLTQGLTADKIILAGFSQGGVIALHVGLGGQQPLAGVLALSTYCPLAKTLNQHKETPITMMHGLNDPIVPLAVAEASKKVLSKNGYQVAWRAYPMQHQLCAEQVQDIEQWLIEIFCH